MAWVEGGGAPIVSVRSPMVLQAAGEWAVAEGAVGVVARRVGDDQGYWWGPGRISRSTRLISFPGERWSAGDPPPRLGALGIPPPSM